MRFPDDVRVRHLQSLFCAREAIYVEKGALRVRVNAIRRDVEKLVISAELSEIPTPGFRPAYSVRFRSMNQVRCGLRSALASCLTSPIPPGIWVMAGGRSSLLQGL
jgi:hypothetical protein